MSKKASPPKPRDLIVQALRTKSAMKQDVFKATMDLFELTKELLKEIVADLEQEVTKKDERLTMAFTDKGATACELKVAGDAMAAGTFALGTAVSVYLLAGVLAAVVTLVGAFVTSLLLSLVQRAFGGPAADFAALGLPEVGALLVYALGSLVLSQLLWIKGVRGLGIGVASMHINAAPFYVMTFMMLLGHPWNGWQAVGALVVGAGVLISQIRPRASAG